MKKDPGFVFRLCVLLGDTFAIVFAFAFAYIFRVNIDQRPYYFDTTLLDFASTMLFLIPIWVVILMLMGLYSKKILTNHINLGEIGRMLAAAIVGIMALISYDFAFQHNLFPSRIIAAYATILCFISLVVMRLIVRTIRVRFVRKNHGILRVVIVGNHINTKRIAEYISKTPEEGYKISGIVANNEFIPEKMRSKKFTSLKEAFASARPDIIFQTDERQTNDVYKQSLEYHALYYYVPSETTLYSHAGDLELVGEVPAILVRVSPLSSGRARFLKRATDIILGLVAFIIAFIPMVIIWLIEKIIDPKHPAIYAEYRLSRFNQKVKIYKFRSMKPEFSGMSPEDAFIKMGKEHLIKKYRDNGDYLKNDPRITKLGRFIRSTSLDELPQLVNVIKGDISLVGPRALVPGELKDYGDRSLLLLVKSGLTGLAQVSGRRELSFEERRSLDLYYIQNWSLAYDLQILVRTIGAVLIRKGAK